MGCECLRRMERRAYGGEDGVPRRAWGLRTDALELDGGWVYSGVSSYTDRYVGLTLNGGQAKLGWLRRQNS